MRDNPKKKSPVRWVAALVALLTLWFVPWAYVNYHDFEFQTERVVIQPLEMSIEVSADHNPHYAESGTFWDFADREKGREGIKAYPKPDGVDSFQSVIEHVLDNQAWFAVEYDRETVCGFEAVRFAMHPHPVPMKYLMVIDAESHIVELTSQFFRKPADRMFNSLNCDQLDR